jgi:hypothetical protein
VALFTAKFAKTAKLRRILVNIADERLRATGRPLERRTAASRTQADAGLFRTLGGARIGAYRIIDTKLYKKIFKLKNESQEHQCYGKNSAAR